MKKLLAAAAIAAGLTAFAPTVSPAGAAAAPPAGTPLVCTMEYHQIKGYRWGGGANLPSTRFQGSCLGLTTLQSYPISQGPAGFGGPGGDDACLAGAPLDLLIGGVRYGAIYWRPLGLPAGANGESTPQVAVGPVTPAFGGSTTPLGLAAFVGTQTCRGSDGADRLDGTMILTMTAPDPVDY